MFCHCIRTLLPTSPSPPLFSLSFLSHLLTLLCLNPPSLLPPDPAAAAPAWLNPSLLRPALPPSDIWAPEFCCRESQPRQIGATTESSSAASAGRPAAWKPLKSPCQQTHPFPRVVLLSISHSLTFAEKIEARRYKSPHPNVNVSFPPPSSSLPPLRGCGNPLPAQGQPLLRARQPWPLLGILILPLLTFLFSLSSSS